MAEKNNELLLQNHQSRPTGLKHFLKKMLILHPPHSNKQGHKNGPTMGKGRGHGGGQGRGRGNNSRHHNTGPFKNKKGNSSQGKLPIHRQPLARVSLNANKIIPAIDVA